MKFHCFSCDASESLAETEEGSATAQAFPRLARREKSREREGGEHNGGSGARRAVAAFPKSDCALREVSGNETGIWEASQCFFDGCWPFSLSQHSAKVSIM